MRAALALGPLPWQKGIDASAGTQVTMGKKTLLKQNRLYIKPNFVDCLLDLPN